MTDGVSLTCDNCLVERVSVQNGDDCVVFKSPSSNSLVRDVDCRMGGGTGLGTVGHKGVWAMSNITFDNIRMTQSFGASIKSFPDSTGRVSNIYFRNIHLQDVNYAIFAQQFFLKDTSSPLPMTWESIHYSNFTGTTTELVKAPILIRCSQVSSCVDFTIQDFKVKQAGTRNTPFSVENACGLGPGLSPCSGNGKSKSKRLAGTLHRRRHLHS